MRLVSSRWFSCGLAVSMGEAAKPLLFEGFQLWNLEEAGGSLAQNARFFLRPRVSSRVAGFPVGSPCLWGKLQNLSFSKVSKQVVMSLCVAGVALCDIPTLHSALYTLHSTLHALHFTQLTAHFNSTLHTLINDHVVLSIIMWLVTFPLSKSIQIHIYPVDMAGFFYIITSYCISSHIDLIPSFYRLNPYVSRWISSHASQLCSRKCLHCKGKGPQVSARQSLRRIWRFFCSFFCRTWTD